MDIQDKDVAYPPTSKDAMLRIVHSTSAAAAKKYYSEGLTREGYYSEGQEMAGLWGGRGARMLGLSGPVEKSAYALLCDNIHPILGGPLTQRMKSNRRPGYDFNFNLPKSVSLAYMWCKDDREEMMKVVARGVRETMNEIEMKMATRVREGGKNFDRLTKKMVWAEYFHFTARPVDGVSDPHLHAHIYVFNATLDPVEQKWKAGQFGEIKSKGADYQAAFLMRVATGLREMGFKIEANEGSFEIAGISSELRDKFSRRAKEIEAKAKELGITDAKGRDGLAATTRENKRSEMTLKDLEPHWWDRLSPEEKKQLDGLANRLTRSQAKEPDVYSFNWKSIMEGATPREPEKIPVVVTPGDRKAFKLAVKHVFHTQSVATADDLLREACKRGYGDATREGIQAVMNKAPLIWIDRNGKKRVTIREVVRQEKEIVKRSKEGLNTLPRLNPLWAVQDTRFNEQQCDAVYHILNSNDFVTGLVGKAGVGKTTVLKQAASGIKAAGHQVKAFSPTAQAARRTLRKAGFEDADTLDKLLVSPTLQNESRAQSGLWMRQA